MSLIPITRRSCLAAAATIAGGWTTCSFGRMGAGERRIATFRVDVTPPLGHPLLGGGFRPAEKIGDPLYANGLVFTDGKKRIVYVTVDWCEIRNEAYARWRNAIAKAVDTSVDCVLVSCVHQHDAPYVDTGAQRILSEAGLTRPMCDPAFHERTVERVAAAAGRALDKLHPLTHLGRSRTKVERIASSRRVLKPEGTPYFGRYSTCRDAKLSEQPEGEIDPSLTSLTFFSHEKAVATLHAYAVHPMSPYGGGVVSADFVGDARARREAELFETPVLYGTGCAGDVTAGKYNDGSPEVRAQLAQRLLDAMERADRDLERMPVDSIACRTKSIILPHWNTPQLSEDAFARTIADENQSFTPRVMAALGLSSRRYHADGQHIDLQVIDFGAAQIALFPAESFVSFQLQVQQAHPTKFILPIGFGECAPGYIPTVAAIREGFREEHGYCWVDDTAEKRIVDGMTVLLS